MSIILASAVIYENYCNIFNIFPETHKVKVNYRERLNKSIGNGGQQHTTGLYSKFALQNCMCQFFSTYTLHYNFIVI